MVSKTTGNTEAEVAGVGKTHVPTHEDPEGAMPTLVIRMWPLILIPVGVEELTEVAMGQVLRSLGSIADFVSLPTQV